MFLVDGFAQQLGSLLLIAPIQVGRRCRIFTPKTQPKTLNPKGFIQALPRLGDCKQRFPWQRQGPTVDDMNPALSIWVVVKIMAPFGYPKYQVQYDNKDPKRDHNFDNHPYIYIYTY